MVSVAGAIFRVKRHINYGVMVNGFHQFCALNHKWRWRQGLTSNPTTFGPLTNLPDYSFKDGRPTPLGTRQKTRMDTQKQYAERIVKLVSEIDYAVDRHARQQEEEKRERQRILDSKLKPKGDLLLQESKVKKSSSSN
ncbi:39S ribosomal protein L52, mitochondrial [Ooceraea biroi]|uniref:39S ribosomal protein L52, mitochondrial n=1 Tax=Ooceraea biroi TaxID=2015173 RepID=UPI000F0749B9|nr:39S ribosomal protein L52, mitochondrial [Ooceraea biroi]